jgi:predicted hotdog family 3-hydroxylacyl-ACP dehydratase
MNPQGNSFLSLYISPHNGSMLLVFPPIVETIKGEFAKTGREMSSSHQLDAKVFLHAVLADPFTVELFGNEIGVPFHFF